MPIIDPLDMGGIIDPLDAPKRGAGPELRQGTAPGVWDKLTSVFKDPAKEAARATKAIVDAESLQISPSAAYAIPEKTMKRAFDKSPELAGRRDRTLKAIKKFNDTGIEDGWQESLFKSIESVPFQMQVAAGGLMQMFEELSPVGMGGAPMQMGFGLPPVEVMNVVAGQMEKKEVQTIGREMQAPAKKKLAELAPNVAPGSLKDYTNSAVNSVGLNVSYLLPSLVTGNPAFGLALMGLQATGEGYPEQREGGSSPWTATLASLGYGASEVLTEFIPMGIYLKPGKQFVKRLVEAEFSEIPTEAINTLVTAAIDKVTIKPETTLRDALDQVEETIYVTALSTLGLAGASHTVNKAIAKDLTGPAQQAFNKAKNAAINTGSTPQEAVKVGLAAAATIPEGASVIEAKQAALVEEAATMEAEQTRLAAEVPAMDDQSFDETMDAIFSGERNLEELIIEDVEDQPEETEVAESAPEQIISDNMKTLSDSIAATGEATIEPVLELGRVVFEEGSTLEIFTAKMKEIAGELWEKIKPFIQDVFNKLTDTRGLVGLDIDSVEIDGVSRPTKNSSGQPLAQNKEDIKNFWKWFGESQAVDDEGKPLIVFHGGESEVTDFSKGTIRGKELGAAYFTNSREVADAYAKTGVPPGFDGEKLDRNGNVTGSYLSITRPVPADPQVFFKDDASAALKFIQNDISDDWKYQLEAYIDNEDFESFWSAMSDGEMEYSNIGVSAATESLTDYPFLQYIASIANASKTFRDKIMKEYDGYIFDDAESGGTTYTVFSPTQIKSVFNSGAFDPQNTNILSANPMLDPAQIVASLSGLAKNLKEDIPKLIELGKQAYTEGASTIKDFSAKMQEWLGDKWDNFKEQIAQIFNDVKDKLKEERGSFSTKDVKPKVREVTGQNKPTELKAMAEEYKKAERYSKIGFKEGVKAGVEQANAPKQESVKGRVRRITGQTSIVDMVREDEALRAAFKKAEQAGRIAYREGNKAGVAEQKAVIKELIAKTRAQALATKEVNKDIKAIKKLAKVGKGIDVEFQRRIKAAVENLDFTKLSEKKIEELNELQKLIDDHGSTIGIPQKRIDEISRLGKMPIRDMAPENIKELRDQLEHLVEVGKMLAEMKYQYKEEERLKKLDEVILTTNNIDPDVKLSEDRMRDKVKIAGTVFYTDTLHTPRVAELADNFRPGPQQEFIRRIGEAESQLTAKALQREISFLEGMKETGLEIIEEGSDSDIKMMIVMRYREGSITQAETLMDHYGYNTVPTLNEQEEKILALIKEDMQANKAGLAAVFEEIEQEIFPEQNVYYLPLKYEKEEEIVPDTQVQGRGRTTHTFDGFKNKRKPGVSKLPRVGVLQIYKEAVLEQEWYKGIQPVIQDIKSVVLTEEYKEAAGIVLYNWWKDEIDIVARRGWSASASLNAASSLMRRVRHNLNTAILGFKVSTIIMQPMAVFDAMAYTNAKLGPRAAGKVLSEVLKSFIIPGRTKSIVAGSDSLKQRQGGELAITEELLKAKGETVKDKATRTAFKWISQADLKTAAGVQEAIRKVMVKSGMSEEEALKEAEFTMKLSQGDSSIAYRPHILSQGEGARTWFTFQTFVMNRWGIIVHDLIAGKISHGTAKEKILGLVSLGILMMAGATEDEAREWLYELISGKKMKADNRSIPEKVLVDLSSTMPFFGSFINAASSGMDASPPVLRTLQQGLKGLNNTFTGKDTEKKFKGLMKSIETGLILGVGFPGTAQFFDLLEGSITKSDRR